jgi:hypothetical protein
MSIIHLSSLPTSVAFFNDAVLKASDLPEPFLPVSNFQTWIQLLE